MPHTHTHTHTHTRVDDVQIAHLSCNVLYLPDTLVSYMTRVCFSRNIMKQMIVIEKIVQVNVVVLYTTKT